MKPAWGMMAVVEKPDRVLFCAPSSRMLQAGILDRLVSPPATPGGEQKTYRHDTGQGHCVHNKCRYCGKLFANLNKSLNIMG